MKYLLVLLLLTTPALAQTRVIRDTTPTTTNVTIPCDPLHLLPGCASVVTGGGSNITSGEGDLWQRILAVTLPDLQYAKALADASGTPGAKLRSQCLEALITTVQQANGANLKNPDGTPMPMPTPHVVSSIEQAAEVIDNLQATSPIISSCAAAANAASVQTTQFLGALLAGVAVVAPK